MIYEFPDPESPIRQGDIFVGLPRIDLDLSKMIVVEGDSANLDSFVEPWENLTESDQPIRVILPVRSVAAIVITQDCDAVRAPDISLCEIRPFPDVEGKAVSATLPKAWVSILTEHARKNLKWFYLPPSQELGFERKMAVDFRSTIRMPGPGLESLRRLRRGRLIPEADEHFRERLSEFFRRYPYDEWYPFDAQEFREYQTKHPDAEPREWQHS